MASSSVPRLHHVHRDGPSDLPELTAGFPTCDREAAGGTMDLTGICLGIQSTSGCQDALPGRTGHEGPFGGFLVSVLAHDRIPEVESRRRVVEVEANAGQDPGIVPPQVDAGEPL